MVLEGIRKYKGYYKTDKEKAYRNGFWVTITGLLLYTSYRDLFTHQPALGAEIVFVLGILTYILSSILYSEDKNLVGRG